MSGVPRRVSRLAARRKVRALKCAATTAIKVAGSLTRFGGGALATLDNRKGSVEDFGTGTIAAFTNTGSYSRIGLAALTITTAVFYSGSSFNDPAGSVVFTNPFQLPECNIHDLVLLNVGSNRKYTVVNLP